MRANRTIFRIGKLLFLPSQLGIQTVEIFDKIDSGNRDIRLAGFGKRFPGFPGRPGHVSGGYTLLSIAELYLRPGGNVNNHEKSQRSAFKEHVGIRNPLEPAERGFSVPICFSGSIFAFFVVTWPIYESRRPHLLCCEGFAGPGVQLHPPRLASAAASTRE